MREHELTKFQKEARQKLLEKYRGKLVEQQ
jgi:hypothetical protein